VESSLTPIRTTILLLSRPSPCSGSTKGSSTSPVRLQISSPTSHTLQSARTDEINLVFVLADPVLYSYPAEVQTYSTRSKGLLVWNTCSQLFSIYTTYVDSIALDVIGKFNLLSRTRIRKRVLLTLVSSSSSLPFTSGYKYYIVYMPLIVIQWCLAYCCTSPTLPSSISLRAT